MVHNIQYDMKIRMIAITKCKIMINNLDENIIMLCMFVLMQESQKTRNFTKKSFSKISVGTFKKSVAAL